MSEFSIKERLALYQKFGWSEKALTDEHWYIRIEAYEKLDYIKNFFDDDYLVRMKAYENLGWSKKSVNMITDYHLKVFDNTSFLTKENYHKMMS